MEDKEFLVTLTDLENAFCEWDRRYSEETDRFDREMEELIDVAPERRSLVCALYLLKLVDENRKQEANGHLGI